MNVSHGQVRDPDGAIRAVDVAGAATQNGAGTTPAEINDDDEIVGWITNANNVNYGFVKSAQKEP
jgi:hypothetical protein